MKRTSAIAVILWKRSESPSVNVDRIFIFGWTVPLITRVRQRRKEEKVGSWCLLSPSMMLATFSKAEETVWSFLPNESERNPNVTFLNAAQTIRSTSIKSPVTQFYKAIGKKTTLFHGKGKWLWGLQGTRKSLSFSTGAAYEWCIDIILLRCRWRQTMAMSDCYWPVVSTGQCSTEKLLNAWNNSTYMFRHAI